MTKDQVRSTEEALKLALEALEGLKALPGGRHQLHEINMIHRKHDLAITTIKEALALVNEVDQEESSDTEQPAQQEPVAWMYVNPYGECEDIGYGNTYLAGFEGSTPLYTSPPSLSLAQRQARSANIWAGLTQQDIDIAFDDTREGGGFDDFARAIEAKLKEKNT